MDSQSKSKNFLEDFFLGGVAATFSKTLLAPLRRIRVIAAKPAREYIVDNFVEIYREEGLAGYWRGHSANVVRYFPIQALNFAFNDIFKQSFSHYDPKTEFSKFLAGNLASGGAAGAMALLITYPLDTLRIALMNDASRLPEQRKFTGMTDCMKKIFRKNGLKGFYQGAGITLPRAILYRGLYFGGYETGKKVIFYDKEKPGIFGEFLVAQGVTMVAQLVSWPLEMVRRRYLTHLIQAEAGKAKLYTGVWDCAQKIYEKEGGGAFYRGVHLSFILGIAPSLTLVLYDEFQNYLHGEELESLYE